MAHAYLGLLYSTIGESVLSVESTTKARQLRDRVSDREKFFIDSMYDRQVTGNLEKAYQTLELWLQSYPRKQPNPLNPIGLLGGLATHGTARYDRAIEACQKAITAEPDSYPGYACLVTAYYFTDRFPESESIMQRAAERKVELVTFPVLAYNIAVLKGDQAQRERAVALARGKHGMEHVIAHAESLALARAGRLEAARLSSGRAVDLVLQEGNYEAAATYWAARAVWEAAFGNSIEGRKDAIAALELSKGRDVQYAAGFALGLAGDYSRSEALAGDLEKRFPEDTFAKFSYVPVLRAIALMGRKKYPDSVADLEIARHYELAVNGLNFHNYLGGLHSAYVRGEAFAAGHRYAEAADEFQKILDHRGIVGLDPIGALAHLQLGRVFALSGDKARAKAAYETFLALWKDADPTTPVWKKAKAEYGRLSL